MRRTHSFSVGDAIEMGTHAPCACAKTMYTNNNTVQVRTVP